MHAIRVGILSAVVAQVLWGLFPVYWKWLAHVNPVEVLGQRNLWCTVCLGVLVGLSAKRRSLVVNTLRQPHEILRHLASAVLIAANWLVYIWAVVNDHVIDASLGYFLSPLVSVALGACFFRERPDNRQYLAIALAVIGVLFMVVSSGNVPWIGLSLAATFGIYGMARKKASTGPINGLFVESLLLIPLTMLVLTWLSVNDSLYYSDPLGGTELLLALGGLVTALPLVLYAQGARALPLSLSGLLVYITPSIQFLIGLLIYKETVNTSSWLGFICVWAALFIYATTISKTKGRSSED